MGRNEDQNETEDGDQVEVVEVAGFFEQKRIAERQKEEGNVQPVEEAERDEER